MEPAAHVSDRPGLLRYRTRRQSCRNPTLGPSTRAPPALSATDGQETLLPEPHHIRPSALPRIVAHGVVVGALAVIAVSSIVGFGLDSGVRIIPMVRAENAKPSTSPGVSRPLLRPTGNRIADDRSALSARSTPRTDRSVPLPTPVPIDPMATPLPAPPSPPNAGSPGLFAFPVPDGSVSQFFRAGHEGVDIAATPGSPVVAADEGVVTWAGWRINGGGLVIEIDHGNGVTTAYNHLGSVWVAAGQYVARGGQIAGMGCTGVCFGPHVQFDVRVNGGLVDPSGFL